MRHKFPSALLAFSGLLFFALPVLAHHSVSSVFDSKKPLTATGVLKNINWRNPHVYFYMNVKDKNGRVETWSFESYSPTSLRERGLPREAMLKRIGESMTVKGWGARDNTRTLGWINSFTFANGQILYIEGIPPGER